MLGPFKKWRKSQEVDTESIFLRCVAKLEKYHVVNAPQRRTENEQQEAKASITVGTYPEHCLVGKPFNAAELGIPER
jgi:hypothetical protein